jgi:hypothetical protein
MRLTELMLDAVSIRARELLEEDPQNQIAVDERLNLSGSLPAVDKLSLGFPEGGALAPRASAIVWL